ncbi:MAG TPA: hypothetical protein VM051_11585 [Usitatibacter sp.]|nr:hypothetical protein [Usitatibacter sp.]
MSRILVALSLLFASTVASAQAQGVAVTPLKTAVVGGESQVFSARFVSGGQPLAGERVRFFNDACGYMAGGNSFAADAFTDATGTASITFTALNGGFTRCTLGAQSMSTGAAVLFDVITYRVANVSVAAWIEPNEPRPGQPFTIIAAPYVGAYMLYNVNVSARVVSGTASASLAPATVNTGQDGIVRIEVTPDGRLGDYQLEVDYRGRTSRLSVAAPTNPWQDLWWSGPAENGWGMSIVQHRDMLFSIVYAYDETGKPAWYVMPSGQWNDAHTAFSGDVFIPKGSPYTSFDAARFDIGASAGRATITFDAANHATLDYSIKGAVGHKALSRILFGQGGAAKMAGLGDMWWGGTSQNGWGFSVLQQGPDLFSLWFTYDETGAATWFVMPAGGWVDSRSYRGALYRSTSSAWLGRAYDPAAFRMNELGWYNMRYNEDGTATFQYAVGGGPVATLPLTRIPF